MIVYLVQHAEAFPREEDPEMALTEKGIDDIRKIAKWLGGRPGVKVTKILHSGKKRAADTAKALASILKPPQGTKASDGISPLDDPFIWIGRLAEHESGLMLVGHLPHLDRLTSILLCEHEPEPMVTFRNAGVVCLQKNDTDNWTVAWMIIPELI